MGMEYDQCTSAPDTSSLYINQTPAKLDPDPKKTISILARPRQYNMGVFTMNGHTDALEATGTFVFKNFAFGKIHLRNYSNPNHVSWIYTVTKKDGSKPEYYYLFNKDSCNARIDTETIKDVTVTPLVPK